MINSHRFGSVGAVSPTTYSGCVLWLDASDGASVTHVANAISQWNDKSGNANHATQATAGLKPTYGTDATTGLGKVSFASDMLSVADHASLDLTTGITIMVAVNVTTWDPYATIVGKDNGAQANAYNLHASSDSTVIRCRANATYAATSISITGRRIFTMRYNSTSIRAYKDGTLDGTTAMTTAMTTTANPLTIFAADATPNLPVTGDAFEIAMWNNDIGDSAAAALTAAWKTKWATT
jgi:hypothetical protein